MIFECPFRFVFLVQMLLPTFMDLCLDFAATKGRFYVLGLTSNMFVNKQSGFLETGFLNGVYGICTLGLLSVNPSGVYSIPDSRIE